jgi:hypothetical protein
MPDITDLMSNVYDLLAKQIGSVASGSFLQLGWPGISLSPADFKPFDQPNGPYDVGVAEETVSILANIAPVCDPLKFESSGFELDDLYQILIAGAVPVGADPNNPLNSPAYKFFSDAQFEFVSAQRGSPRDPNRFYYPCRATPVDWYTEENARTWTTLSVTSDQLKPAGHDSPFIKLGGRKLVEAGVLKVAPAASTAVVRANLEAGVRQRRSKFEARVPAATFVNARPLDAARVKILATSTGAAVHPLNPASAKALMSAAPATMAVAKGSPSLVAGAAPATFARAQLRPTFAVAGTGKQTLPAIDAAKFDVVRSSAIPLNRQLFLRQVLSEQLVPTPVAPATNGFSISFKFCLVTIDRSWLKAALLSLHNWYMLGTKAGEYSQGTLENNPGMFTMLPTAFVAVRDLKITANWSPSDAQAVAQSKSFGPFDVRSATFNQSTLEAKQLQVFAWVTRLMSVLPPQNDPALP